AAREVDRWASRNHFFGQFFPSLLIAKRFLAGLQRHGHYFFPGRHLIEPIAIPEIPAPKSKPGTGHGKTRGPSASAFFDVVQLLAPEVGLAPAMTNAFADQRAAGFAQNSVIPLANGRNVFGRRKCSVGELHGAPLVLPHYTPKPLYLVQACGAASERPSH